MLGLRARNRSAFRTGPGQAGLLQGLPAKTQKTKEILKTIATCKTVAVFSVTVLIF